MNVSAAHTRAFGSSNRGVAQSDVSHAADSLLLLGERPTNDKVRNKIGRGSLTTIGPLLDAWWKTLSLRLDSGPAAFHRLPEVVAHVAESLWMHAQEEAGRRLKSEQKTTERQNADKEQTLEVRSHVLTLREGELDSRLRDRDRTIKELNLRLREITGVLRKEQAERESLMRQLNRPTPRILTRVRVQKRTPGTRTPPKTKGRAKPGRASRPRVSKRRKKT